MKIIFFIWILAWHVWGETYQLPEDITFNPKNSPTQLQKIQQKRELASDLKLPSSESAPRFWKYEGTEQEDPPP